MWLSDKLKDEFRLRNFTLRNSASKLFVSPQFGPQWLYTIWVTLMGLYHVTLVTVTSVLDAERYPIPPSLYPIVYLTNWSYYILTLMFVLECVLAIYVHCGGKYLLHGGDAEDKEDALPWYLKVGWLLFTVATDAACIVTVLYWTLLATSFRFSSIARHALNSVFALMHLMYTAKPIRILHVIYPFLYSLIYVIFSVIYQFSTGDYIYEILDWYSPTTPIIVVVLTLVVGVPIVHLLIFLLFAGRSYLGNKLMTSKVAPSSNAHV